MTAEEKMREVMLVVRRALIMIVKIIERVYNVIDD